jgi:hypothetical protein
MIDSDSDHRFWGHFNALIGELEDPPYRDNPFYSALASKYEDPVELLEDAIVAIRAVINDISTSPRSSVESQVWNIILLF